MDLKIKTYGILRYVEDKDQFLIEEAQPHVCIKLKSLFQKIAKYAYCPFKFENNDENCVDLLWFCERYPLKMDALTSKKLNDGKKYYNRKINDTEAIMLPDYKPQPIFLKNGFEARGYQLKANEIYMKVNRLLLGDDTGLGKTLTSILSLFVPNTLPCAVVVQTHMVSQWRFEAIERFTSLKVHEIKSTSVYDLPNADVYIFKYTQLAGWSDIFATKFFKSAIFDECQEFRRSESAKYGGGLSLSRNVLYAIGLSATPIYNYGDEIFNVLDLISEGCLGQKVDFLREWAIAMGNGKYKILDPTSLGTYLRDNFLMLRRTRKDVGRELPPINKIVHTVDYDHGEVKKIDDLARDLAMKVLNGSFIESGKASLELDAMLRRTTGVAKARPVAAYVRILLENGEKVVLSGWHRDVYNIWQEELAEFEPLMYTGTENAKQKEISKQKFIHGENLLLIISNRSGAGLDGLQFVCNTVVIGELDWSPKVLEQLISRVDRGDDFEKQTTAIFLVSDSGCDPAMIDVLALKNSQSTAIIDPSLPVVETHTDDSRIKHLAKKYLKIE